jgi:hypothetical protein
MDAFYFHILFQLFAHVKKSSNFLSLMERLLHAIFGLRHYVSPEITVAKSSKWQNKMNFICTFGFFVVILQRKIVTALFERMKRKTKKRA